MGTYADLADWLAVDLSVAAGLLYTGNSPNRVWTNAGKKFASRILAAEKELIWIYDDESLKGDFTIDTVANTNYYDAPTDAAARVLDLKRIIGEPYVVIGTLWEPLLEGIPPDDYTLQVTRFPTRWQRRYVPAAPGAQIELWPVPDDVYTCHFYGYPALTVNTLADTSPETVLTIADHAAYRHAMAFLLEAYGKPGAASAIKALGLWMGQLRAKAHGDKRYVPDPGNVRPNDVTPKPTGTWQ